jgi:chemotaxis protein CheX
MINLELAGAFIDASNDMLSLELGLEVDKGSANETSPQGTLQEVNILVGVTGALSGTVIYSMGSTTAKIVAGIMLAREIETLDRNAQSALCELGNMISGMAISRLDADHSDVALTPPSLVVGKDIFISVLKLGCIHAPLRTESGVLDVTIALEERVLRHMQVAS